MDRTPNGVTYRSRTVVPDRTSVTARYRYGRVRSHGTGCGIVSPVSTNTEDPASAVAGIGVARTISVPAAFTIAGLTVTDTAASVAFAVLGLTFTRADASSRGGVVMYGPQRGTWIGSVTSSHTCR